MAPDNANLKTHVQTFSQLLKADLNQAAQHPEAINSPAWMLGPPSVRGIISIRLQVGEKCQSFLHRLQDTGRISHWRQRGIYSPRSDLEFHSSSHWTHRQKCWRDGGRGYLACDCAEAFAKSLSCVRLFATLWTVAPQAPPSMEFSRQEYWSSEPYPSPGDLPNSGTKPAPLISPA